jgi:hypothetical protein
MKQREILKEIAAILNANIDAVMAVTNSGSEYNGDVVADIYKVFITGNEVLDQGTARIETRVRTQRALPRMTSTANPVGAYAQTPGAETATTTYSERILTMRKGMLYETFDPDEWQDIWDEFASQGNTYTNLAMNPVVMNAVMMLYQNRVGSQFAEEFWQNATDGIITLAAADAAVIDVVNQGVIVEGNVVPIVEAVWTAIPDQFFNDPNFNIHMNTTDYKLLQLANQSAADSTSGYLNNTIKDLFLSKRIKHYAGLPKNSIVAAKGTTGVDSNLIWGFYATPDTELGAPRLDRVANNSEQMFVRVNFKRAAQYREGSEIVLYQGA